jgi:exodeoxyribonuclease VII small subunit
VTSKRAPDTTVTPVTAAALSYEAAIEKLESIVAQIESGEIGLEESMQLYEEGTAIAARCKEILATAEQRVEQLARRASEPATVAPSRPNSGGSMADKVDAPNALPDDAPFESDDEAPF